MTSQKLCILDIFYDKPYFYNSLSKYRKVTSPQKPEEKQKPTIISRIFFVCFVLIGSLLILDLVKKWVHYIQSQNQ